MIKIIWMKVLVISALFATFSLWPSHNIELPKRAQKKVQKAIEKTWKDQQLEQKLVELELKSSYLQKGEYLIYQLKKGAGHFGYALLKRTKACRAGGCTNEMQQNAISGNFEYFDFLMLLDSTNNVAYVDVVNYQAQYGYEICNKRWLKQFKGFNGKELTYGKEIQAISGATISASAITDDIQVLYQAFIENGISQQ